MDEQALDEHLEALASEPRRRLLLALVDRPTLGVPEDVILRSDADDEHEELALRHCHVPKLADHGYVEWDRKSGELSRGPAFDSIERVLLSVCALDR
ncbi:transcriptional regulator [Halobium salinum]|uniref:Transcriptional regulator n=1 Tax=Halobium salinum TaxID=1364940 RepID=A0ABD5PGZ3_9EURY|nr:hypothetical protein [Halobium salinum]